MLICAATPSSCGRSSAIATTSWATAPSGRTITCRYGIAHRVTAAELRSDLNDVLLVLLVLLCFLGGAARKFDG